MAMMVLRALHAHDMLDCSADAERQIQLGRDCLAGRSDLAIHGEPSRVADRSRRRDFSAQRFGKLLREFNVLLFFDPAADGHNDFRLREIHRLLGFFEDFLRLVANDVVGDLNIHGFDRSRR